MKKRWSAMRHETLQTAILTIAKRVTGDVEAAHDWFFEDPIRGLDGLTAAELVAANRGQEVLQFLLDIAMNQGEVREPFICGVHVNGLIPSA